MTTLEHVARAICIAHGRHPDAYAATTDDTAGPYLWELELPAARAAIQALREPGKAVEDAVLPPHLAVGWIERVTLWRAAIDAILNEPETEGRKA